MHHSDDSLGKPQLDYEAWRALVRSICARHNPEGIEPNAFLGWARPLSVCGLAAVDLGWNAHRIERTHRDVRLDGVEHYCALFQLAGQSMVTQNDQSVQLTAGDVALVDMARPVTYFASKTSAQWLALHLPRQSLVAHPIIASVSPKYRLRAVSSAQFQSRHRKAQQALSRTIIT